MNETVIEQLTKKALVAGQNGQWGLVAQCYAKREALWQVEDISPEFAQKLVDMDKRIARRIHEVKAAVQEELTAVAEQRRKLASLKQQWVGNRLSSSRHLKTA